MDLTNYLPPDLIDLASAATPRAALLARPDLDRSERLTIASIAMVLNGGAKIFRPSTEICEVLKHVELRISAEDYAQPYAGLGVVLPGSLFGGSKDRFATSFWEPGHPFLLTFFGERRPHDPVIEAVHLRINPPPGITIEEYIADDEFGEGNGPTETARIQECIPIARVVMNLCLFAVERGVRVQALDPRAEKRRRKARSDERMARLAARDAQEVIIQDLDLILRATSPSGEGEGSGGWRQRMHRRRGHWKMQAYGPGRTLRKRIFVRSYMVHAEDNPDGEVQSILS